MSHTYPSIIKPEDLTVAQLWVLFAGHVLPVNASPLQRSEMQKAFYAGFFECFKVMVDYATELPAGEPEKLFDRLQAESSAFFERMMKEHKP
jgi:hypothetical protein